VTTGELNRAVREIVSQQRPRAAGGRLPKVYYATQTGVAPVTIVLFVSNPKAFDANYLRYVSNALRKRFPFPEIPIRVILRESGRDKAARGAEEKVGRGGPNADEANGVSKSGAGEPERRRSGNDE
jgi:GTP-binding protein